MPSSDHTSSIRFVAKLIGFATIQLCIGVAVWFTGTPPESDHYLVSLQDKDRMLQAIDQPRLILVGGSSLAFGIDSALLESKLRRRPINMGVHSALGLDFMLDSVRDRLRPGDWVIVSPEYKLVATEAFRGDSKLHSEVLQHWPQASQYLRGGLSSDDGVLPATSLEAWKDFFDHRALAEIGRRTRQSKRRLGNKLRSPKTVTPSMGSQVAQQIYRRGGFNQYGDLIAHHGQRCDQVRDLTPLSQLETAAATKITRRLNQFHRHCREIGVTVFFAFPPVAQPIYKQSESTVQQIYSFLEQHLDMPLLNTPEEACYPLNQFFDTGYHLRHSGAQQRSESLARAVLRYQVLR